MRVKVTALGGARQSLGRAVGDIVRYLIPDERPRAPERPEAAASPGTAGPAGYYADRGEEPGRWYGRGAARLGLAGEVRFDDFETVLSGRDPATGIRLISARGSAGRRPELGVGNETRWADDGEPLYGLNDTAAALDVPIEEAAELVESGTRLAAWHLFRWMAAITTEAGKSGTRGGNQGGNTNSFPGNLPGSYLVPILDGTGEAWITESELTRAESEIASFDLPPALADGDPEELLPLGAAAAIAGVTPRYLRTLVNRYAEKSELFDALVARGEKPQQAFLIGSRGQRNWWFVRRKDLTAFVKRREPPPVRVAFDVTLTTEKSFSVAALLADTGPGSEVLAAVQTANETALAWLEEHASAARVVQKVVDAEGLTVASFRHLTSRALDPFVHHHNIVANSVEVPDVGHRALDARELYNNSQAAGALATAEARWRLTTRLGVRWRQGQSGAWEVAGIPDEVLRHFSQRRNEVEDAVRELEEEIGHGASPDQVDYLARKTRPDKEHVDVEAIRGVWWDRARSLGFEPDDLARCFGQPGPEPPMSDDWVFARLASPDAGVCRDRSVFDIGHVLAALVELPIPQPDGADPQPLVVPAEELRAIADAFLASDRTVRLRGGRRPEFTTREILDVQERIVARFERGLESRTGGTVTSEVVAQALVEHDHLDEDQRRLVTSFCTSGYPIQCAVGHPGAGKTTAMAAARAAWESAGWRVVGAAVKGEAARILGDDTGMRTETLAWWLAHDDPRTAPVDASTVLVVDEASTISDRDLDKLGWLCRQTRATLRLIGDPVQHGAVEAGGMFRVLCELHPGETPSLETTHRVRDPHDRAAAEALRRGAVDEALDHLSVAGHLHIVEDEVHFYREILARWWAAHRDGLRHPMVDGRNAVRRRLNRLAHRLLQAAGQVASDELQASGDRGFAVGDRVIARVPARDLHPPGRPQDYVRNGAVGVVTRIAPGSQPHDDTLTVDFDATGSVTLPRRYFDAHEHPGGKVDVGLDHAYAVTSYAVQGSTSAVSTSRIDDRSSRAELLVDITRGRDANHVYVTRSADGLDDEQLPRVETPSVDDAVARRLHRSRGERTAWELAHHPDASDDIESPNPLEVRL